MKKLTHFRFEKKMILKKMRFFVLKKKKMMSIENIFFVKFSIWIFLRTSSWPNLHFSIFHIFRRFHFLHSCFRYTFSSHTHILHTRTHILLFQYRIVYISICSAQIHYIVLVFLSSLFLHIWRYVLIRRVFFSTMHENLETSVSL